MDIKHYIYSHIEFAHITAEKYNFHLLSATEKAEIIIVKRSILGELIYRWVGNAGLLCRLSLGLCENSCRRRTCTFDCLK